MRPIALFLATFNGGGAERMVVNLANGLTSKYEQVDLLVGSSSGPYLKEVKNSVNLIDLKSSNGVTGCFYPLVQYLNEKKPKSILTTQTHSSIVVILAEKIALSNTKVIIREANTPSKYFEQAGIKHTVLKILSGRIYPLADKFVAVSKGVKEDFKKFYDISDEKIDVLYNPVVDKGLRKLGMEKIKHPWFKNRSKEPVIIGMGRITPQKGFEDLIESFSLVRNNVPAKLIICGKKDTNKEYFRSLKSRIKALELENYIQFPGFVDNPFKYLSKASLFVLSSKFEGLPGVLIQALACGCPVVSTDCPSGPREILENGKYGELVTVGDCDAMAEAIIKKLENQSCDREKLIERSLDFSLGNSVNEYEKLFL